MMSSSKPPSALSLLAAHLWLVFNRVSMAILLGLPFAGSLDNNNDLPVALEPAGWPAIPWDSAPNGLFSPINVDALVPSYLSVIGICRLLGPLELAGMNLNALWNYFALVYEEWIFSFGAFSAYFLSLP